MLEARKDRRKLILKSVTMIQTSHMHMLDSSFWIFITDQILVADGLQASGLIKDKREKKCAGELLIVTIAHIILTDFGEIGGLFGT